MSVLAIGSDQVNIYQVGDELALRGWHMDRQQHPPSLHLTVTHAHAQVIDQFLLDLEHAVAQVRRFSLARLSSAVQVGLVRVAARLLPARWMSALAPRFSSRIGRGGLASPTRSAAMYGMMASLPEKGDLDELVLGVLDSLTEVDAFHEGQ
jgi:hypothetical protein